jgi:hypothetical protein
VRLKSSPLRSGTKKSIKSGHSMKLVDNEKMIGLVNVPLKRKKKLTAFSISKIRSDPKLKSNFLKRHWEPRSARMKVIVSAVNA